MKNIKYVFIYLVLLSLDYVYCMESGNNKENKQENLDMGSLNVLPKDVLGEIFGFIVNFKNKKDLLNPRVVCKGFKQELIKKLEIRNILAQVLLKIVSKGIELTSEDFDKVKIIINSGANIDLQDNNAKKTLLMIAIYNGHNHVAKLLMEAGANMYLEDKEGNMAIDISKSMKIIEMLKNNGFNLNYKNIRGDTFLIKLCRDSYYFITSSLIGLGVDLNIQDNRGFTALMWAAAIADPDIVKLLIDNGADVNIKNNKGNTALDLAQYKIIIKLLKNKMGLEKTSCTICFDEIKEEETNLECGHNKCFHKYCLMEWLKINDTCPMCRAKIVK